MSRSHCFRIKRLLEKDQGPKDNNLFFSAADSKVKEKSPGPRISHKIDFYFHALFIVLKKA